MILVTLSGQTAPKKLIVQDALEHQISVGSAGVVLTDMVVLLDNQDRDTIREYSLENAEA
jgi:hypothetical protein